MKTSLTQFLPSLALLTLLGLSTGCSKASVPTASTATSSTDLAAPSAAATPQVAPAAVPSTVPEVSAPAVVAVVPEPQSAPQAVPESAPASEPVSEATPAPSHPEVASGPVVEEDQVPYEEGSLLFVAPFKSLEFFEKQVASEKRSAKNFLALRLIHDRMDPLSDPKNCKSGGRIAELLCSLTQLGVKGEGESTFKTQQGVVRVVVSPFKSKLYEVQIDAFLNEVPFMTLITASKGQQGVFVGALRQRSRHNTRRDGREELTLAKWDLRSPERTSLLLYTVRASVRKGDVLTKLSPSSADLDTQIALTSNAESAESRLKAGYNLAPAQDSKVGLMIEWIYDGKSISVTSKVSDLRIESPDQKQRLKECRSHLPARSIERKYCMAAIEKASVQEQAQQAVLELER